MKTAIRQVEEAEGAQKQGARRNNIAVMMICQGGSQNLGSRDWRLGLKD